MSVTLSEVKTELLNKIAVCQGFDDYKIEVKSGSMKGDGYLGIINTIHIQDSNKPNKELNLIIKSAMDGDKLREQAPVRKAYEREIYLYETVFPEFKRFSDEHGVQNKFTETAKCYGTLFTDKQECIVLENLKEIDFKLWNRKLPMNAEHVGIVFATYAKFHGTGLALKNLHPEKFEEMSKNLKNIFYKDVPDEAEKAKFAENVKQGFANGFRAVANHEKATQALTKFTEGCMKFFEEDVRRVDKYCTILHGDCWCNNMMFRYTDLENPAKPTQVCLLDWQISQVASPILDLSYFFYACSSKEVLYDLKKFLKIYHDNLTKTVKEAGLNPEEILTFEELEAQWKIYSKYGLFMALFVMKIVLSEVEEAPDFDKLASEGKDLLQSLGAAESVNIEEINKRISDIIIFMAESEYL
jgi:thiamine kinase-like enzyme